MTAAQAASNNVYPARTGQSLPKPDGTDRGRGEQEGRGGSEQPVVVMLLQDVQVEEWAVRVSLERRRTARDEVEPEQPPEKRPPVELVAREHPRADGRGSHREPRQQRGTPRAQARPATGRQDDGDQQHRHQNRHPAQQERRRHDRPDPGDVPAAARASAAQIATTLSSISRVKIASVLARAAPGMLVQKGEARREDDT